MEQIVNFIKNVKDQDFNAANQIFSELMQSKLEVQLDQEKIKVADSVYNGIEPDEDNDDEDIEEVEDDIEPEVEEEENEDIPATA
jgi:hypothetical protein|tara:strand:- start:61 stop:315 length:255 start_codon:yes stop_codon:yes gene_type:complete